jgi:hypothetical protein
VNKNAPLKRERVCIFIDGSNFYFALKRNNYPTRVDYFELSKALAGPDRELVRTYYYNSAYDPEVATEQSKTQQTFFDSLRKTPFLELRLGRLVSGPEGAFKTRGEKTLFSSDLVYFAARGLFDTAIVVTEEWEFSPVLTLVKELSKTVEIGFFKDSQPSELLKASDRILPLFEVLDKFKSKIFPSVTETEPGPEDNIGNQVYVKRAPIAHARAEVTKTKKFFEKLLKNK